MELMEIILPSFLLILAGGLLFVTTRNSIQQRDREKPSDSAVLLPIAGNLFVQGGLKVRELPHGWLVSHDSGKGGLAFVPKPQKEC